MLCSFWTSCTRWWAQAVRREPSTRPSILKPALGRGEIQIIGATTREEYRRYICKDPALERRFQPVQVEPPTPEQALGILKALRPRYERHHGLLITDEALCEAVRLSERYLPDRYLPDKAIDLMDEAAARVRIRGRQEPPELRRMEEEHHAAETALRQAVEQEQFEQAARCPGSGADSAESVAEGKTALVPRGGGARLPGGAVGRQRGTVRLDGHSGR